MISLRKSLVGFWKIMTGNLKAKAFHIMLPFLLPGSLVYSCLQTLFTIILILQCASGIGLLNTDFLDPLLECVIYYLLFKSKKSNFLTSSWVKLKILLWEPHFESNRQQRCSLCEHADTKQDWRLHTVQIVCTSEREKLYNFPLRMWH